MKTHLYVHRDAEPKKPEFGGMSHMELAKHHTGLAAEHYGKGEHEKGDFHGKAAMGHIKRHFGETK